HMRNTDQHCRKPGLADRKSYSGLDQAAGVSFLYQNLKQLRPLDILGEALACGDRIDDERSVGVSSDRPAERPAGQHADSDDANLLRGGCIDELPIILIRKAFRSRLPGAGINQVEAALDAGCVYARYRLVQGFGFA